jgi:hypothetical protein
LGVGGKVSGVAVLVSVGRDMAAELVVEFVLAMVVALIYLLK